MMQKCFSKTTPQKDGAKKAGAKVPKAKASERENLKEKEKDGAKAPKAKAKARRRVRTLRRKIAGSAASWDI